MSSTRPLNGTHRDTIATSIAALVSLACVVAAGFRAYAQRVPDQEVLLFLVTAAVVQYLDKVSKFKIGSLEFEKKVEDLEGRVDELAELNQPNEEGPRIEGEAQPVPIDDASIATLDEAVAIIESQVYRAGLAWDDDPVGDYFTKSEADGVNLSARVSRSRNYKGRYLVQVFLRLADSKELDDPRAAFFLHHTFRRRIRFEAIYERSAVLSLTARGAFVIGVVLSDGTMLRLDLADATFDVDADGRDDFLAH